MLRSCLLAIGFLAAAGFLPAQDDADEQTPVYEPFTLKQNYTYSLGEIFATSSLFQVVGSAAFDQVGKHTDGWGSRSGDFGLRTASWFGHSFIRENLAFGIRALDGEDPRYTRLGHGGVFKRTAYAIGHTFAVRGKNGGYMPAWSFLADYATPFIVREWEPGAIHPYREAKGGSIAVASIVGMNFGKEFWPDVKKKLQRR